MTDYLDVIYKDDDGIIDAKVGFFPGVRDEIPEGYVIDSAPSLSGNLEEVVDEEFGGVKGLIWAIENNSDELKSKVLKLARKYSGVESEVLEILKGALDQDLFNEYAERLRKGSKFVGKIDEEHRHAHTYVIDFLTTMKGELGLLDDSWSRRSKEVAEYDPVKHGPGLVLLPKDS